MRQGQVIHITFHNPNTEEETARFLAKVIASSLADQIIRRQTACPQDDADKQKLTAQ